MEGRRTIEDGWWNGQKTNERMELMNMEE